MTGEEASVRGDRRAHGLFRAVLASCAATLALVSCGGGGGGGGLPPNATTSADGTVTLKVAVIWPRDVLQVYKSATVRPLLYGFGDHTPVCMIISGHVPAGMVFGSDCTIAGRPTESGTAAFTVRVGASGVSNTVVTSTYVSVSGPGIHYSLESTGSRDVGQVVNDPLAISSWAPDGRPVAWTFAVKTGTLPGGLVLDSTTGTVSGTLNAIGSYNATIAGTASTEFGTVAAAAPYGRTVGIPGISYENTGGTGSTNLQVPAAYVGQAFSARPFPEVGGIFKDFTLPGTQLPAGLALDPATGRITGEPTATAPLAGSVNIPVRAVFASNGTDYPTQGTFRVSVGYPFLVTHSLSGTPRAIGVPLSVAPTVTTFSPLPLVSPSISYAPIAGECSLPTGVSFDSSTGIASGTPTVAGSFLCNIGTTLSNNGQSWSSRSQLLLVIR